MIRRVATASLAVVCGPALALAHMHAGEATGFFSGAAHPISGLDHVLAMVAVGLWGFANGGAMAQSGAGIRGVVGSAVALFVVATLCSAAAVVGRGGWLRVAWRVLGSWIAAGGLLLLGWALR